MAYSVATWSVTPDMWNIEKGLTVIKLKYLVKSSGVYYTFNDGQWLDLETAEPTQEDFEVYGLEGLSVLLIPNEQGIKPILQLESPEIIVLADLDRSYDLHIKGFKNILKNNIIENPELLINSDSQPQVNTVSIPKPQLVLPKGDIVLRMLQDIETFQITSNPVDTQNIKMIFSVDSGETWKTFNKNELLFEDIDIENLDLVRENGIDVETFNTIGVKWNEVVTEGKIRFGYLLEMNEIGDVVEVDKLDVTINITGSWKSTEQGVDYNYGYGNKKINVKIFEDGSYKINYM